MIFGRFSTRGVALTSVGGIVTTLLVGGGAIALADGLSYFGGIWMAFNVVTTIGFGPGPATGWAQLAAIGTFVFAGMCGFGLLLIAIETAQARFQRGALVEEALRPLARRRGGRLFHHN
jgi:hypothetical protein